MTTIHLKPEGTSPATGTTGRGEVRLEHVAGRTAITRCHSSAPIKLLTPNRSGQAAWVYVSSYGGGLVSGDRLEMSMQLGRGSMGVLTTQASTKVYHRQGDLRATQLLEAQVADEAVLFVAPDPITCFEDADYEQRQVFDLTPGGSLLLLDWFTAGRLAMGERWAFERYFTDNLIRVDGKAVALDRLCMDSATASIDAPFGVGRYNCYATVMLVGPAFESAVEALDEAIGGEALPQRSPLPVSFSKLPWGGVLRLAGLGAEPVREALAERLKFVEPMLGCGLWARKW